jgi:hypothetical protein
LTTCAAGRPATGATPVSISAIPTPWPVSDAAAPLSALMIDRTLLSVVPVPAGHSSADQPPPRRPLPPVGSGLVAAAAGPPNASNPSDVAAATNPDAPLRSRRRPVIGFIIRISPSMEHEHTHSVRSNHHDPVPYTESHDPVTRMRRTPDSLSDLL